nr:invertase, cell-wall-bound - garden pea [Pisum sativum]
MPMSAERAFAVNDNGYIYSLSSGSAPVPRSVVCSSRKHRSLGHTGLHTSAASIDTSYLLQDVFSFYVMRSRVVMFKNLDFKGDQQDPRLSGGGQKSVFRRALRITRFGMYALYLGNGHTAKARTDGRPELHEPEHRVLNDEKYTRRTGQVTERYFPLARYCSLRQLLRNGSSNKEGLRILEDSWSINVGVKVNLMVVSVNVWRSNEYACDLHGDWDHDMSVIVTLLQSDAQSTFGRSTESALRYFPSRLGIIKTSQVHMVAVGVAERGLRQCVGSVYHVRGRLIELPETDRQSNLFAITTRWSTYVRRYLSRVRGLAKSDWILVAKECEVVAARRDAYLNSSVRRNRIVMEMFILARSDTHVLLVHTTTGNGYGPLTSEKLVYLLGPCRYPIRSATTADSWQALGTNIKNTQLLTHRCVKERGVPTADCRTVDRSPIVCISEAYLTLESLQCSASLKLHSLPWLTGLGSSYPALAIQYHVERHLSNASLVLCPRTWSVSGWETLEGPGSLEVERIHQRLNLVMKKYLRLERSMIVQRNVFSNVNRDCWACNWVIANYSSVLRQLMVWQYSACRWSHGHISSHATGFIATYHSGLHGPAIGFSSNT